MTMFLEKKLHVLALKNNCPTVILSLASACNPIVIKK